MNPFEKGKKRQKKLFGWPNVIVAPRLLTSCNDFFSARECKEAERPVFQAEALNTPDDTAGEVEELNGFFRRCALAAREEETTTLSVSAIRQHRRGHFDTTKRTNTAAHSKCVRTPRSHFAKPTTSNEQPRLHPRRYGGAGKGLKGHRSWRVYFAWRGMADADSPLTGERSNQRHTRCGFNGGNDYPVTVATIEDPAQRLRDEREGIYKTLGALYYFQHELGVNWSLAEDEGYATPYNRAKMHALDLRPDLEALAVHLPQQPYVRECRRIIGVRTLVAQDLTRFDEAKHFSTSVAMGDYFMDLDHGKTARAIESDLDTGESPKGGGPFQVPFEVFIPEKVDGFLPAEKNLSQSRLANGATRLQPITMLTGQAAGAIAALAVKQSVQPRALDPLPVQQALLDAGCTLIQRWYVDVPQGTALWRATQLLSLHEVLDRPGAIERDNGVSLAAHALWGVGEPLKPEELRSALTRLAELKGIHAETSNQVIGEIVTAENLYHALESVDPAWGSVAHTAKLSDPAKVTAESLPLSPHGSSGNNRHATNQHEATTPRHYRCLRRRMRVGAHSR